MQSSKLNELLQISSSVAVLIGLVIVGYEIRQTNHLARADAARELIFGWSSVGGTALESGVLEVRSKSLSKPDELTQEEILKLSEYFGLFMNQLVVTSLMTERGLGYDFTAEEYESYIALIFRMYFGDPLGRSWYSANRGWISDELVQILDYEVEAMAGNPAVEYYESLTIREQ